MSLFQRLHLYWTTQRSKFREKYTTPEQLLTMTEQQMDDTLQDIRKQRLLVLTSLQQLTMQVPSLEKKITQSLRNAQDAVTLQRDDLATQALQIKNATQVTLDQLHEQIQSVKDTVTQLTQKEFAYQERIEQFRMQKTVTLAQYTAAQTHVTIAETISGLSSHAEDLSSTVQRTQNRITSMQARAQALTSISTPANAVKSLHEQIQQVQQHSSIEAALAQIKAELASPPPS